MTRLASAETVDLGPLDPDWTIAALLDWIGADDARCHDERLTPVLSALATADGSLAPVVLVRALVARVVAEPDLARRRVGEAAARAVRHPDRRPRPAPAPGFAQVQWVGAVSG